MRHDEGQGAGATLGHFVAATSWADVAAQSHEAKRSILNFFATALGSAYDPAVSLGAAGVVAIQRRCNFRHRRPAGTARCARRRLHQCDFGQSARFRRHPSGHHHPSGGARSPRRFWRWRKRGGFPDGTCSPRSFSAWRSSAGSEMRCLPGTMPAAGTSPRPVGCSALPRPAPSCSVFRRIDIKNAIGIAASQSAGIVENLPTAAKNVSVGNAARNGLFAALLAAEGYAASARAIEGPLGWARAMGDEPDLERLIGRSRQELGDREEHLQALSCGDRVSCRHRRLLQFASKAQPAYRRYRVDHGAGLGAVARAR